MCYPRYFGVSFNRCLVRQYHLCLEAHWSYGTASVAVFQWLSESLVCSSEVQLKTYAIYAHVFFLSSPLFAGVQSDL